MINERTLANELWTQVCLEVYPELDELCMTMGRSKRFAELVVQECASLCNNMEEEYLKDQKNEYDFDAKHIYAEGGVACSKLKTQIKNKFGMK